MAQPKRTKPTTGENLVAPKKLSDDMFYGLQLSDEQKAFRDAIWDPDKEIVFCNAKAGTGKTTVAVGTQVLLVKYGIHEKIHYITSAHAEGRQGFLPGTIEEKSKFYHVPLLDALIVANENPAVCVVSDENILAQKNGTAYVTPMTDTFLRGRNISGVVIIDESQNYDEDSLRKTLTRCTAGSKIICIGHTGQCDLDDPKKSAFERCMKHFIEKDDKRVAVCELTQNFRSWVAQVADEKWN